MKMEEKKYSCISMGNVIARAYLLYPVFEKEERITLFYRDVAENLGEFWQGFAADIKAEYEGLSRAERKNFQCASVRAFASVSYMDEKYISVMMEYVICRGKEICFYRKLCQVWARERQELARACVFLPKRYAKKAEKNEFYLKCGKCVIVENLFPHTNGGDGRRLRLCDYIAETAVDI